VISTGWSVHRSALFTIAALKLTVPKLVSGKMPPLFVQQGASAMTSAEDRAAPASLRVAERFQCWVASVIVSRNLLLPRYLTEAENRSPALTVLLKVTSAAG
jgi:hypothetical protein